MPDPVSTSPTTEPPSETEVFRLRQKVAEQQAHIAMLNESRKEGEQTHRLFRLMTENVDDLIAVVDRQGKRVWNNPAYMTVLGYSPGEIEGSYSMLEIHPDDQAKVATAFYETMQTGSGQRIEYRMQHRNGNWITLESQGKTVLDDSGQVEYIILVARDITSRLQVEEERAKAGKIEAIGIAADGVAHEFNDIITGMLGFVENARRASAGNDAALAELAEAARVAEGAAEVTRRLSDICQRKDAPRKLIAPAPLLEQAAAAVTRNSRSTVQLNFAPDLDPILADEDSIMRVFNNVVNNAIEAMPSGGRITIGAQNATINASSTSQAAALEPGRYVRIDIRDEGVGIAEPNRVFEPYFSTKTGFKGLGLTTSLSIVKKLGGTIIILSVPNVGSTVNIYLPAAPRDASPPTSSDAPPAPKGKAKILVMDDEKVIRDFVSMALQHLGYEVVVTSDGAQAIAAYARARAQKSQFDGVIMDLIVPNGVGGLDALKTLLKMNPEVKVIMSSGHHDHPAMVNYHTFGISGIIQKPYAVKKLVQVLEEVLGPSIAAS